MTHKGMRRLVSSTPCCCRNLHLLRRILTGECVTVGWLLWIVLLPLHRSSQLFLSTAWPH